MLKDHQWELLSAEGESLLVFGTADTGIQTEHAPDVGQTDIDDGDRDAVREDGRVFGRDYRRGNSITFEVSVLSSGWGEQADLLARLRGLWEHRRWRLGPPGAQPFAVLRTMQAGRVREIYGRPRRYAPANADLEHDGYTAVVMDFATIDGRWADLDTNPVAVPIVPPSTSGISAPIVAPITTDPLTAAEQPGALTIPADTEALPEVTFTGPVTDPEVQIGDLTVGLRTTLADGEQVTCRPHLTGRGVFRVTDGANYAGRLTHATPPMGEWWLDSGTYEVVYRGTDPTGTSMVTVTPTVFHSHP